MNESLVIGVDRRRVPCAAPVPVESRQRQHGSDPREAIVAWVSVLSSFS
jgi:hypothetical protein